LRHSVQILRPAAKMPKSIEVRIAESIIFAALMGFGVVIFR